MKLHKHIYWGPFPITPDLGIHSANNSVHYLPTPFLLHSFMMRSLILLAAGPLLCLFPYAASSTQEPNRVSLNMHRCDTYQQELIYQGWDDAMLIADIQLANKPRFRELPENHFLGDSNLNAGARRDIEKVLKSPSSFWRVVIPDPDTRQIDVHCDDPVYDPVKGSGGCKSSTHGGSVAAYTLQEKSQLAKNPIMTFCPPFFNPRKLMSCGDVIKRWGKDRRDDERLNLRNYQCRGYAVLHELFHLDWVSQAGTQGHIHDLKFEVLSWDGKAIHNWAAYGPEKTKVLSAYKSYQVGHFINKNADNLAQYSLAKWVMSQIKEYPALPVAGDDDPIDDPVDAKSGHKILQVRAGQLYLLPNATWSDEPDKTDDDESDDLCSDLTSNCRSPEIVTITGLFTPTMTEASIPTSFVSSSKSSFVSSSKSSTVGPAAPTAGICSGNQVKGSCAQAHLPKTSANAGPQGPVCQKYGQGPNDSRRIDADKANQAAADYCAKLKQDGITLSEGSSSPAPYLVTGAAEGGGDLALTVLFYKESCPLDGSTSTLDFSSLDTAECQMNFYGMIDTMCLQDTSWGTEFNADYTLEGGTFANDCGLFSMYGQAG